MGNGLPAVGMSSVAVYERYDLFQEEDGGNPIRANEVLARLGREESKEQTETGVVKQKDSEVGSLDGTANQLKSIKLVDTNSSPLNAKEDALKVQG